MKKGIFVIFLLVIGCSYLVGDLLDVYKTGSVKLVPDPEYGKNTDWEELIYSKGKYITVGPDGCVFMADARKDNICKFDAECNLIKTFGRPGQGPGDLTQPSCLSFLDKKYLVVKEHLAHRRVSVFDLNGNFVKLVRTKYNVFHCVSLRNNKIAIYECLEMPDGKGQAFTARIYVIDIISGNEKMIYSRKLDIVKKTSIHNGEKVFYHEEVFLHSTPEGNILLGFNNNPDIKIYSPEGKLINSFKLKINQERITSKLRVRMYNIMVKRSTENPYMPEKYRENYKKALVRNRTKIMSEFKSKFPYYTDLMFDSDGNILVLKNRYIDEPNRRWTPIYQVYSGKGDLKCEFKLNFGKFDVKTHISKLFFKGHLYGIFEIETKEHDLLFSIAKMNMKPVNVKPMNIKPSQEE